MTNQEFLDGLKDIVQKAENDKDYLDSITDDVADLLDEYDSDEDEDELEDDELELIDIDDELDDDRLDDDDDDPACPVGSNLKEAC